MGEVVLAACTDDNGGIFVTDLQSGALVTTFEESSVQPHVFGTIGERSSHVYAAQAKKALWNVWSWGDKKPCYRASLPEKMSAMAFTRDAGLCFGGSVAGSIYVWQMGTGCLLRCWPAHFREVTKLLVSEDASFLVSASADATVHVYNLADVFAEQTPRPFHSWSGHALAVTSLALLPGAGLQRAVASASLDRSVRLWDVGTGKPLATRTLGEPVHQVVAGAVGTELLCACGGGELRSLVLSRGAGANGDGDGIFSGHVGAVLSCALSADGSRAASCSEADRVRVWDARTQQCVSQVHTSRNVQIGSVQIVNRAAHAPPPFQPFQRLLTAAEDTPAVPIRSAGRAESLKQAMEPQASSRDFIDRIVWGQASGLEALARVDELQAELVAARKEQARWASAAVELYDALVEEGPTARAEESTASASQAPVHDAVSTAAVEQTEVAEVTGDLAAADAADTAVARRPRKKKRRRQTAD